LSFSFLFTIVFIEWSQKVKIADITVHRQADSWIHIQ